MDQGNSKNGPHLPERGNTFVIVLIIMFGQGSWIALNGLWVELPVLVSLGIPEGFNIATWLVLIIQLANVGPLLFTIINYLTPSQFHLELQTNYIITALGAVVTFLLIFLWDEYSVWKLTGKTHSTALLICAFVLSIVDCTSSVAFTPFMSRFKSVYVTWYFIGEGFSALTPSIFALVQGVASNAECIANQTFIYENDTHEIRCFSWVSRQKAPRFGPGIYFTFLFAMAAACFTSFLLLNILPLSRREQQVTDSTNQSKANDSYQYEMVADGDIKQTKSNIGTPVPKKPIRFYLSVFTILGIVNALSNSVLPSVQSFSAGAYGLKTYLVAATLACVSKPLAAFFVLVKPMNKLLFVGGVALLGISVGSYCMLTAFMSPSPPMQQTATGRALIVSQFNRQ